MPNRSPNTRGQKKSNGTMLRKKANTFTLTRHTRKMITDYEKKVYIPTHTLMQFTIFALSFTWSNYVHANLFFPHFFFKLLTPSNHYLSYRTSWHLTFLSHCNFFIIPSLSSLRIWSPASRSWVHEEAEVWINI